MSSFDKIAVGAALLLIGISLLNPGGLIIGAILGVSLLVAVYGGKYLLQLEKSRRMGERAPSMRDKIAGAQDDDGGWRR